MFSALTPDAFGVVMTLLVGLCFGSFGTMLLARLPAKLSIGGRSRCPQCKTTLRFRELCPVLSYLWLRGKCAHCRTPISSFYLWVEVGSAALFLLALYVSGGFWAGSLLLGILYWLLFLIALSDARTGLISDALNIPFILLAFAHAGLTGSLALSGALLALVVFGGQWLISKGRWVGSGDILLTVGIGALLGTWELTLVAFCMAYIVGAFVASVLLLMRTKKLRDDLVFGPFLAMGAVVVSVMGYRILEVLLPR